MRGCGGVVWGVVWGVCWGVCGACVGVCWGFMGEKVSLAPLYYPDTFVNPDTCLGEPCNVTIMCLNKSVLKI